MIQCTSHQVALPFLPDSSSGLRVVQLSDLHCGRKTKQSTLDRAITLAQQFCPHVVVLTGDFVTRAGPDVATCGTLLKRLSAPLGIFAVLGNHDYSADARAVRAMLADCSIQLLSNESVRLDSGIWLAGLEDLRCGNPDPWHMLLGVPDHAALLVLSHNPVGAEMVQARSCMVLSGHTHGGQILLPFFTRREVRRIGAKHYRAGWYTVGMARLYVNRGLGQVGLPFRFLCPPEVTSFTFVNPKR